mgnify:CR=1 FL=1
MTIRNQLREALSGLSLDNTPTVERQEKSQFSLRNNVWHVRTIAERLYGSERITQEEYDACQRWAATYVLTYDGAGTVQEGASTSVIKHDAISFAMHMAGEKDCIPAIKSIVGKDVHALLILSLYHCYSAAQIGAMLLLEVPKTTRERSVDTACRGAYKALYRAYYELQKVNKKKHAESRAHVL